MGAFLETLIIGKNRPGTFDLPLSRIVNNASRGINNLLLMTRDERADGKFYGDLIQLGQGLAPLVPLPVFPLEIAAQLAKEEEKRQNTRGQFR